MELEAGYNPQHVCVMFSAFVRVNEPVDLGLHPFVVDVRPLDFDHNRFLQDGIHVWAIVWIDVWFDFKDVRLTDLDVGICYGEKVTNFRRLSVNDGRIGHIQVRFIFWTPYGDHVTFSVESLHNPVHGRRWSRNFRTRQSP